MTLPSQRKKKYVPQWVKQKFKEQLTDKIVETAKEWKAMTTEDEEIFHLCMEPEKMYIMSPVVGQLFEHFALRIYDGTVDWERNNFEQELWKDGDISIFSPSRWLSRNCYHNESGMGVILQNQDVEPDDISAMHQLAPEHIWQKIIQPKTWAGKTAGKALGYFKRFSYERDMNIRERYNLGEKINSYLPSNYLLIINNVPDFEYKKEKFFEFMNLALKGSESKAIDLYLGVIGTIDSKFSESDQRIRSEEILQVLDRLFISNENQPKIDQLKQDKYKDKYNLFIDINALILGEGLRQAEHYYQFKGNKMELAPFLQTAKESELKALEDMTKTVTAMTVVYAS